MHADKDVPVEDKAKMYGDFRQEVWLMSGLVHPNVVSLMGYCTEPYAMVMDFVACGDLYGFLHDEKSLVDWPIRLKIALDIAKGMEFLHTLTPPLLHRDLKSPNILLDRCALGSPLLLCQLPFTFCFVLLSHVGRVSDRAQHGRQRIDHGEGVRLWPLVAAVHPELQGTVAGPSGGEPHVAGARSAERGGVQREERRLCRRRDVPRAAH